MIKLYMNIAGWQKVRTPFFSEQDMISTMIQLANQYNNYYFMVIERLDNTDDVKVVTRSEEDFNEYIQEVRERYNNVVGDNTSCLELKRQILRGKKL